MLTSRSGVLSGLAALLVAAASLPAAATVTEPNGLVVPLDSMNGETQLYTLFQSRSEPLDFQADGHDTPATFSPFCDFSAELVLNQTASVLAVGWYNADPNAAQPPAPADIHEIVPAGSPVGTVITAADIRNDPAYAGGLIGFALVGWQTHYTEARWNPVCTGCNPPGSWIMSVIYASAVLPNAYYVTFEDGSVGDTPASFNNDGDYNDYVYLFQGLACSGGGDPCQTGLPGVCATGLTECDGVTCRPDVQAGAEVCDGLDNNCDGATDEGDLCDAGFVCDQGHCVESCNSSEFPCSSPKVCSAKGFCVDADCVDKDCPAGEICVGGDCKAPCDGVSCPAPLVCRVGACVDPCDGVVCDTGEVCDGGVCRTSCSCAPCASGLSCEVASGLCKDPACVDKTCGAGEHCDAGQCVDSCLGAVCPSGQVCETGGCVDGGGGTGGAGGAGGSTSHDGGWSGSGGTAGTSSGGSGGADGGVPAGGAGGSPAGGTATDDGGGCGCRSASSAPGSGAMALGLIAALALSRRRGRSHEGSSKITNSSASRSGTPPVCLGGTASPS